MNLDHDLRRRLRWTNTGAQLQGILALTMMAFAAGGCGGSDSDDSSVTQNPAGGAQNPAGGTGGDSASGSDSHSGGFLGGGPSVGTGGSSSGGGAASSAPSGGTTQSGGETALGESGGVGEGVGGSEIGRSGGAASQSGGAPGGGGSPGTGEQADSGGGAGQSGGGAAPAQGSGGTTPSGGAASNGGAAPEGGGTAVGGLGDSGGQSEVETGGLGQSGGTAGAEGLDGSGAHAGQATGGNPNTGGTNGVGGQNGGEGRSIAFGTLLDPQAVMLESRQLAESLVDATSPQWRAAGDQHRSYHFDAANADSPYRICVPTNWDGQSELPLMMYLHGAGSDENTYLDQNNKQMVTLAQEYGFLLVSPMGAQGAYGNFLRLSAPFGNEQGAADLMAQVTNDSERTNELSEMDVINVLELVLAEYPVDRDAMFLAGHSMGSGGTWYIGGKYSEYWRALAPMSGPFVQESGYPWEDVRDTAIFVTEGTQTPSLDASRLLRDWLLDNEFNAEYKEVDADHGGMIQPVLPDVFEFFRRAAGI